MIDPILKAVMAITWTVIAVCVIIVILQATGAW